jgi:hypothetical protein
MYQLLTIQYISLIASAVYTSAVATLALVSVLARKSSRRHNARVALKALLPHRASWRNR